MAGRRWVKFQQFFFIKLRRRKKKTQLQFFVSSPILNQRRPIRYVLRLIQWQNLKRKIIAVSVFFNNATLQKKFLKFDPTLGSNKSQQRKKRLNFFYDKLKISDSVDFEQP